MQVGPIGALVLGIGLVQIGCGHAAEAPADTTSCSSSCAPAKMDHHDHAAMADGGTPVHAGPCPDSPPLEASSCSVDRGVTCPYPKREGGFDTWQCVTTGTGTSRAWKRSTR